MPYRLSTIFLAAAVLLANAYCACVSSASVADRESVPAQQHEGCHGHAGDSKQEGGDSHDCGHCTGTVFAKAPTVKNALSTPFVSPLFFAAPAPVDVAFSNALWCNALNHTGLPPPVPQSTLLSLFCSLNH